MSNIITTKTRLYRDVKPPVGSVINTAHPLSRGLVGCWLMNEGGGRKINNIVYNKPLQYSTWAFGNFAVGKYGYELKRSGSLSYTLSDVNQAVTKSSITLTAVALCKTTATTANTAVITKWHAWNNKRVFYLGTGASGSTWGMTTWNGVAAVVAETTDNFDVVNHHFVAGTIDGSNVNIYVDGILRTSTAFAQRAPDANPLLTLFGDSQALKDYSGSIVFVYYYNRALSPSEIQSLYESPYQMIAPQRSRGIIPYGVTGGGGGTLYNQLCNESISASDVYARSWNMGRFLADSITPTDILSRIIKANRIFGDAITPTDSLFRALKANRIFNESVTINDVATRIWNIVRTCNESLTVDDVVSRILKAVRNLSEALTISDSVTYKTNIGIEYLVELLESFAPTDTIIPAKHTLYQLSLVEAMYLNDVLLYWASQVKKTGSWAVVSSSTGAWTILTSSTGSWTRLIS